MAEPYITLYDYQDVLITPEHPIAFGLVDQGSFSDVLEIRVWNDRYLNQNSESLAAPRVSAIPSPGGATEIFDGTELNTYLPMLQARTCGAYNTIPDMALEWVPIGPMNFLLLGSLPAGCGRQLELRLAVPQDAPVVAVKTFTLRVTS